MQITVQIDIPDWVEYVAGDLDGWYCGHELGPFKKDGAEWDNFGMVEALYKIHKPDKNWKKELYKVVDGELVRVTE